MSDSLNCRPTRRDEWPRPGFIDFSPSAGRMLVFIGYRDLDGDLHGMNAWPASGRDLTTYLEEGNDGEKA